MAKPRSSRSLEELPKGHYLLRHPPAPNASKPKKHALPIKQQIRNLLRFINRPNLDPEIRKGLEPKLEALQKQQEVHELKMRAREFRKRYRKVRHVEQVKVERRIAHVQRALKGAASEEEAEALRNELRALQLDLRYVIDFPPSEKYISLFKEPEDVEQLKHVHAERVRLRALVAGRVAEAALLTEADEGKALVDAMRADQGPDDHLQRAAQPSDDDEDDDFFLSDAAPSTSVPDAAGNREEKAAERAARTGTLLAGGDASAATGRSGSSNGRHARPPAPKRALRPAVRAAPGNLVHKQRPRDSARKPQLGPRAPTKRPAPRPGGSTPQGRQAPAQPAAAEPLRRTRAEGGRKRRK